MQSLRSSSALSYNVFGPWRGLDLAPLGLPLHVTIATHSLRFEQKFQHGLSSTPPNIDVVLDGDELRPVGIECKFMEPYGKLTAHKPLDDKYFVQGRSRWAELGLPRCQTLANSIGKTRSFKRLGAGQLLKHLLGLAYTTQRSPKLRYLWFDSGCEEAAEHREEVGIFESLIDDTIDFASTTYQDLYMSLKYSPEPIPGYLDYLLGRYFSA